VKLRSTGLNTAGTAAEVRNLKACVNDLVGVLTLPAMWSGREPDQIVVMLLDVVLRTLRLDFVYARLRLTAGAPIETIRFADSARSSNEDALRQALGHWLTDDPDARLSVPPWPDKNTSFSVAAFRLGTSDQIGEFVAGSRRSRFPSETERLVLNVAANQAAIGLQEARFRVEQRRVTRDLDLKVDQHSKALLSVTDELKRENAQRRVAEEALRLAEARLSNAAQIVTDAERVKKSGLAELQERYARLTPREREVLPFVVAGMLSKQTAAELGTSEITIRVHRGQIMRKMQAHSLAELIRMADNLGIQQTSSSKRSE
jgi:DNA-binding CsgD family transcriptional regulator